MKYRDLKIIFWTAEWCGPCQALKKSDRLTKAAARLSQETDRTVTVETRDVESPQWEKEANRRDVMSMPTIDLTIGNAQVSRIIGAYPVETYVKRWLKALKAVKEV